MNSFYRSFCDFAKDPFCENPSEYPSAIVGRIIRGLNNSASPSSSIFFTPPEPLEDEEVFDCEC